MATLTNNPEKLEKILNYTLWICGDTVMNLEGEYLYYDESSCIDGEILEDAIDGYYSDHSTDCWLLSVATTTRKQPLYGCLDIVEKYRKAALRDDLYFFQGEEESRDELTYMDVYGALADIIQNAINEVLKRHNVTLEQLNDAIEETTIHCNGDIITVLG